MIGCLNLADVCMLREIHMTYFGTGCIFHYDDSHPIGGEGFKESDTPNFTGSYYSHTKVCHVPRSGTVPHVPHSAMRMMRAS